MVLRAKEYITAGDVIQVVLSQCFTTPCATTPWTCTGPCAASTPRPYMFYLDTGDLKLVGASPEILVRLEDDHISYRPIAGTRPRGATPEEDQALEAELLADPKERAEHLMLVDLGRNDVGRVGQDRQRAGAGAFHGGALLPRHAHRLPGGRGTGPGRRRHQTCSSPPFPPAPSPAPPRSGPWRSSRSWSPPAGDLTPGRWATWASAATWIFASPSGVSRFINGQVYLQVGAGIVADSDPAREYQETVNKGMALMRALELAEEGLW